MKKLAIDDILEMLKEFKEWKYENNQLEREFLFRNYLEAMDFLNEIKYHVEDLNHHPDFLLHGYNKIKFMLSTHSAGGVTKTDFVLLEYLERKYKTIISEKK